MLKYIFISLFLLSSLIGGYISSAEINSKPNSEAQNILMLSKACEQSYEPSYSSCEISHCNQCLFFIALPTTLSVEPALIFHLSYQYSAQPYILPLNTPPPII